jgi:hypothetical protein
MNSNMKLNVTSNFDLMSNGWSFASGMRQPLGAMKKAKASIGISFTIEIVARFACARYPSGAWRCADAALLSHL